MKDIKLGMKLTGGFLIVAFISLVVGMVGVWFIINLGADINDIGRVRMPTVKTLLLLQSTLERFRVAQRTLLIPDIDHQTRQRQYQNIEEYREEYKKAFDIYEAIPKTSQEGQRWNELKEAIYAWRKVNNEFLEMSKQLEKNDVLNPMGLKEKLEGFRGDHFKLIFQVQKAISGGASFEGGDDSARCALGKWMTSFRTNNPVLQENLRDIEEHHKQFHDNVTKIKAMIDRQDSEGARQILEKEMIPHAEKTIKHLGNMGAEADKAIELYKKMEEVALVQAVAKQRVALDLLSKIIEDNVDLADKKVKASTTSAVFARNISIGGMIAGFVIALGLGLFLTILITRPLKQTVEFTQKMAGGDFTQKIALVQKDEIGALAASMNHMVDNLSNMIKDIADGVEILVSSSTELSTTSQQMNASAVDASAKSNTVAAAAEEMSVNFVSVAATIEQATNNVNMVATATEEMSSTINEIARSSEQGRNISMQAVLKSKKASERVDELGKAAQEIGKITDTINDISDQTNLLALNATIEAARAGEAGKGFAVVANEIKELAKQTSYATEEIKKKIELIQDSTGNTITDINQVSQVINEVNQIVANITAAVTEQVTATNEIAGNIAQASQGVQTVSQNIIQGSAVASEVAQDIALVNQSGATISHGTSMINMSVEELSRLAERLQEMVSRFRV